MVTCCKIFHSKIPLYGKVKMTIKGPIVLGSFVIVDLFDCDLTQMGPPKNLLKGQVQTPTLLASSIVDDISTKPLLTRSFTLEVVIGIYIILQICANK
jgi:hypothetical protein